MKSVIGLGNALTDILVNLKNDEILGYFNLPRGGMTLMDSALQSEVSAHVSTLPHTLSPGGSASNTIRAMAHLGVRTGYIGKVGKDDTGDFFCKTMEELAIRLHVLRGKGHSGKCVSLVSPDGERTMCTHLGAALEMDYDEIGQTVFDGYDYLYIEGYLVQNHDLILGAVKLAKSRGLQIAIDLASFNVVEEHLDFLQALIGEYVDIVFANEQEAFAFTGEHNPLEALDRLSHSCSLGVIKAGIMGSYIKYRGKVDHVGILVAPKLVDTTGAGDLYAAGFMTGLCKGLSMLQCGTIGAITAGKVVQVMGTTMDTRQWDEVMEYVEKVEKGLYIF